MEITIRPLTAEDLPTARNIFSLAFGTFLGVPEPEKFWTDLDYIGTRWSANCTGAFGAELSGELVGSNIVTRWGSMGFFGPLTVRPELWDRGIGQRLLEPTTELFETWGVTQAGLFTFAHSPKHVNLYQKFDFWPRALTAIMSKPVQEVRNESGWLTDLTTYAALPTYEQATSLQACRSLTDSIYPDLDVAGEISAVYEQGLGDTVLLWDGGRLVGLAVYHWGPDTEAGPEKLYVKFGCVLPGAGADERFSQLLATCEVIASTKGLRRIEAGMNMARHEAYRAMLRYGFRTDIQGVAMHRGNELGYNRPNIYLIDDWR